MGGFSFNLGSPPRSKSNPVEEGSPLRKDALSTRQGSGSSARIHYSETADALLKGKEGGYPADIRMLFIMQTNPINQYPNTNKMVQGFRKMAFIGAAEQVMTATARFADILLPVNTFMERNDLSVGGAIPTCGMMKRVVEPLYESRSPLDICRGLAERLGVKDYLEKTEEEWLREMVKGSLVPGYDDLRERTVYRPTFAEPHVAFRKQIAEPEKHPFPTPSGKIEIYSRRLADMDNPEIPAIPKYIEAWEGRNDPLRTRYPLQLVTPHFRGRAHSQFANLPWLRELTVQAISMNHADAKPRGIKDGDLVRVFNARGVVAVPVRVTERIMPGVVDLPQDAWYNPDEQGVDRGGCVNVLSRDKRSPAGAVCTNTCLVQVEKA
jgi:anaerobic dimethyl sulfoxide reductase subunit A